MGGDNNFQYAPNPVKWVDTYGLARARAAGAMLEIPVMPGHQRHHIIPITNFSNHPAIIQSKFDLNSSKNIIQLPTSGANNPDGRTIHRGMHQQRYEDKIRKKLDKVANMNACDDIKRMHVEAIMDKYRSKLEKGLIKLNNAT